MTKQTETEKPTLFEIAPPPKARPKRIQVDFDELHLQENDEPADAAHINNLARNIHIWHVMNPLIVRERKGGGYEIITGRRRYMAISLLIEGGLRTHDGNHSVTLEPQKARFSKVPCAILSDLPGGDSASAAVTLLENQLRRANHLVEMEKLLILHKDGHDEKAIFRLTGMPAAVQRKRLKLHNLTSQMRRAMNEGKLSSSNAQKVADLSKQKQKEVWANYRARITADGREPTGREKLTSADIAAVKRVQVQESLTGIASMAPGAFEPMPESNGDGVEDFTLSDDVRAALEAHLELLDLAHPETVEIEGADRDDTIQAKWLKNYKRLHAKSLKLTRKALGVETATSKK